MIIAMAGRVVSLMPVTLFTWLLVALLSLTGCGIQQTQDAPGGSDVAEVIRENYDAALPSLSPNKQRHYAQRLYRMTGDKRYLPLNREYGQRLLAELREEIDGLAMPGYAERRAREKVDAYPEGSEKQRRRKKMLAEWGQVAYAKSLAFDLTQAKYHGLLNETDLPGYSRALDYLATLDFRPFLVDPAVMSIYAAQVANLAYYLERLGVVDLREDVTMAFRRQYPPDRDDTLDTAEYRNKIYGMTHMVIAASDYYQKTVDPEEFDWILDEFETSLPRILSDTKEDIYTEVGISFLLADQEDYPVVERLLEALLSAYDPDARMVPSEKGSTSLEHGEHRNVLAIMLLDWPDRFHPGPDLSASTRSE